MSHKYVRLCVVAAILSAPQAFGQTKIVLDDADSGRVFEGIGAISQGGTSRNMVDYPAKLKSEILDYMFKPKFGANLQHFKVEIGGGENGTCGSEPTHALTREELAKPVPRGFEFWLMAEARKRNPQVMLDCLPWSYPYWVSSPFSQDSADWYVAFLDVAKNNYGLKMDWVAAAWNEHGTDLNWIAKTLRPTLDAHGYAAVKLQAPDEDNKSWLIFDEMEKNPVANKVLQAVGYGKFLGWDFALTEDGTWSVQVPFVADGQESVKPLGNGKIDGFTPGKWHHLAVSLKGEDMLVTVDGKEVTRVKYEGYAGRKNGLAYLLSSYDPNCFDNLSVTP